MDQNFINQLKEKLEKEKIAIEEELKKFAKKDQNLKGDWDTKYPRLNGGSNLEEAADEVEQYSTLLPIEHNLEIRLKDIISALEKIEKGTYGKCSKCGKQISEEKLMVYPATETCANCKR